MKRIYIAGPYSADNVITVLGNMRRGMMLATKVFKAGFAPFCPHLDFHYSLMVREGEDFTVDDYYNYSMAWLEASDAVLLLPNWQASKGSMAEVDRAYELGIPVFGHFEALVQWDKDPLSMADGKKPSHKLTKRGIASYSFVCPDCKKEITGDLAYSHDFKRCRNTRG